MPLYLISPVIYCTSAREKEASCITWPILRLSYINKISVKSTPNMKVLEYFRPFAPRKSSIMFPTSSILTVIPLKRFVKASDLRFKSEWPVWAPFNLSFILVRALSYIETKVSWASCNLKQQGKREPSCYNDRQIAYIRVGKILRRWLFPDIVSFVWLN